MTTPPAPPGAQPPKPVRLVWQNPEPVTRASGLRRRFLAQIRNGGKMSALLPWVAARLAEASSWNAIALGLGGVAAFLSNHGVPTGGTWIAAGAAGASALAGFIMKEGK